MDTRYLDPVIGLVVPGLGDVVGAFIGLYTVYVARKMGYSKVILARMIINFSFDSLLGAVPLVGDVFDIFHKSHRRNLALLRSAAAHRSARPSDWFVVLGALALFVGAIALSLTLLVLLVRSLLR